MSLEQFTNIDNGHNLTRKAVEQCHACVRQRIVSVGRPISRNHGHPTRRSCLGGQIYV